MKNWQFFIAIIILVLLATIKIKERFSTITYDIANTINYNNSEFNKMSQELFKKNKQNIKEEDDLTKKNIDINEKIPDCNLKVTTNTNDFNNVYVPQNNKAKEDLKYTESELAKYIGYLREKNNEYDIYEAQLPELNRLVDQTNTNEQNAKAAYNKSVSDMEERQRVAREKARQEHERRKNLPSGYYSIISARTGQYCSDEADGHMVCNRGAIGAWEKFYLINLGGGYYNIKGGRSGRYCVDDGHFSCNRGAAGEWEKTQIIHLSGSNYYMRGGKDKKICSLDGIIRCNGNHAQLWETFIIQPA
jgi:hypothetical protein